MASTVFVCVCVYPGLVFPILCLAVLLNPECDRQAVGFVHGKSAFVTKIVLNVSNNRDKAYDLFHYLHLSQNTYTGCEIARQCCQIGCSRKCIDPINVVRPGKCPVSTIEASVCIYDSNLHCVSDSACQLGQKCCPNGCNSVCKWPIHPIRHPGVCPKPSGIITTCEFRPGYNCLRDSECHFNSKCCSEGCGKICKISTVIPISRELPRRDLLVYPHA